jgi:hypothetical protein
LEIVRAALDHDTPSDFAEARNREANIIAAGHHNNLLPNDRVPNGPVPASENKQWFA